MAKYKLTKKEENESMMKTWGRIISLSGLSKYGTQEVQADKLVAFIEKFGNDLSVAKIEEEYFTPENIEKRSKELGLDTNTSGCNNEL